MIFFTHILEWFEHVLSSGYGKYFVLVPFIFAVLYLILYVILWGGHRD